MWYTGIYLYENLIQSLIQVRYGRTYYKDWTGVRKQKTKRGFKRKCDAQEWERAFKLKENLSLDMYFEDFVDLYLNDIKSRIKYNTWLTKKHIVEKKILPYFSKKKLQEIKPFDIRQWQNTMMNYRNKQGEGYSQVYLKTIHNQLSAILNHAVNFYDLKSNAARKAGSMGKERTKEMLFWTKEEYIHDLRHSHVSLLINMGYSAVAIGERVGHESVEITYRYAHLFPTIQTEMAENLNQEREEYLDE